MDEIKKFDDPGLVLIGFKPMSKLKTHHHIRPAVFIYPEEEQISGESDQQMSYLSKHDMT